MTIPNKFRKSEERVVTSYDFYDLAAGVGYKILNGSDFGYIHPLPTSRHLLTPNTFYAQRGYVEIGGAGVDTTNYDMPLNNPITVGGDIIYEMNLTSDNAISVTISAGLFMVKDGIETQIGDYQRRSGRVL